MEKATHWSALWRELVEARTHDEAQAPQTDLWADRARAFDERVKRRWSTPDSSRDFICSRLDPDATVLDIGAGTGAWTAMFAQRVRHVTAVDPSPSMLAILRENLAEQQLTNVSVIEGAWPDVAVEPHDFSLCSHAMYGYPDFPAFIRRMVASTRRMCFLIVRAPIIDGVMAEASRHVWGQPFDSPNFTVAYNSLLQMGIYPNVLMENTGRRETRTSPSLDAAVAELKRSFRIGDTDAHDAFLSALVRRRLIEQDGQYVWPREVYSALVYWTAHPDESETRHRMGAV